MSYPQGTIPIGQGFYIPLDPQELFYQVDLFRSILIATTGAYVWEHIVTFHEELYRWGQLLQGKPTWVGSLVLVARYSIWGSIVSALWFFYPPTKAMNCQVTITMIFLFMAISYICLANVFVVRVKSLWSTSAPRWFAPMLHTAVVIVSGCWLASVAGFHGDPVPDAMQIRHAPVCIAAPAPYWRVLGWSAAAVFDVIIYVLTLIKINELKHITLATKDNDSIQRLRAFVFNSSTIYFVISFSCNVGCALILSFYRNMILQNIPILVSAMMNAIIACRVVFHSDLFSDGKTGLLVIDPLRRSASWRRRERIVGQLGSDEMIQAQQEALGAVPTVHQAGAIEMDQEPSFVFNDDLDSKSVSLPPGQLSRKNSETTAFAPYSYAAQSSYDYRVGVIAQQQQAVYMPASQPQPTQRVAVRNSHGHGLSPISNHRLSTYSHHSQQSHVSPGESGLVSASQMQRIPLATNTSSNSPSSGAGHLDMTRSNSQSSDLGSSGGVEAMRAAAPSSYPPRVMGPRKLSTSSLRSSNSIASSTLIRPLNASGKTGRAITPEMKREVIVNVSEAKQYAQQQRENGALARTPSPLHTTNLRAFTPDRPLPSSPEERDGSALPQPHRRLASNSSVVMIPFRALPNPTQPVSTHPYNSNSHS